MARFVRFAAAFLCLPFAWALCLAFVDALCLSSGGPGDFFTAESIALFAGLAAFPACLAVMPDQTRIYVLGHELTHAIWGLAFGARVSRLKVSSSGGSVMLSKSNVWITLAPYFFPFWTAVVALLALATKVAMYFIDPGASFPVPWLWMFAVGFTWCFHACFTIRSLMQTQPDIQEYGRLFSWTLIFVCNAAGALAWIVCTTDVPAMSVIDSLLGHTASSYSCTARAVMRLIGMLCAQL